MSQISSYKISSGIKGDVTVPGDKSISHRSIMFGSISIGQTRIKNLLNGEDVMSTINAFRSMGVDIFQENNEWVVNGSGIGGLTSPTNVIDMGNSGTSTRLIMGIVAAANISCVMTGDESLVKRPMLRVINPLSRMGVSIISNHGCLPVTIENCEVIIPMEYELEVESAQVKSCVLLAGLGGDGVTTVIEKTPTRDNTEKFIKLFGGDIDIQKIDGKTHISVSGKNVLKGQNIEVPGDPSSAAFVVAAAVMCPGSDIVISNISINPTRIGFYIALKKMGANIKFVNERECCGEVVADIAVKYSKLSPVNLGGDIAASMIDEYPILSIVCASIDGVSRFNGVEELRYKESDRIEIVEDGLRANGIKTKSGENWLEIHGQSNVSGGGIVKTHLDHRIGMSFLILGLVSDDKITIDDVSAINTSFPGFVELMNLIGGYIR